MTRGFRFARGGRQRLQLLDGILDAAHGAPESLLGNQEDALDEAIYIILSFQTDLGRLRLTWERLRSVFPRWEYLDRASIDDVADVLRVGGLHRQKAKTIKRLVRAIRSQFGEVSLRALREMDDAAAERALTRLPGLSWKGARCVLLYSLRRNTLPVDSNTFRILDRAGVIPRSAVYRRKVLHDALQAAVPANRRRRLHVNLVVHGQRVCLPRTPCCESCVALPACQRRGQGPLNVRRGGIDAQPTGAVRSSAPTGDGPDARHQGPPVSSGRIRLPVPQVRHSGTTG